MSFEIKIHGITLSARTDGRVGIAVENGSRTLSAVEFGGLVRLLDAVSGLVAQQGAAGTQAAPPAPAAAVVVAPAPASAAAAAEPAAVPARRGPGRPRKILTTPAAAVAAPAADASAPVKRGPGRPRKILTTPAAAVAAPAADGAAPIKRGPGRPRKNPLPVAAAAPAVGAAPIKRGPGRPRKDATAAPATARAGDAPAKRGPGRPRKDAAPVAPKVAAAARAAKAPSLRDQLDAWMQQNPGPKTIGELVQAAVDGQWPVKGNVQKLVETTVPRLHEAFLRTPDGAFVRRGEIEQAKPGKIVLRRRGATKPATPA